MTFEIGQIIEYLDETDFTMIHPNEGWSNHTEHFLARILKIHTSYLRVEILCILPSTVSGREVSFRGIGREMDLYHKTTDLPFIKEPDTLTLGYILHGPKV